MTISLLAISKHDALSMIGGIAHPRGVVIDMIGTAASTTVV